MSATRARVLASYRLLRRVQKRVFCGDQEALTKFRDETRAKYLENISVTQPEHIEDLLAQSLDAAEFIDTQLVQVTRNEQGSHVMKLRKENTHENNWEPNKKGIKKD